MIQEHLLTPGPTQIPLRVFHAMANPTLHHRTEAFKKIFRSAREQYRTLVDSAAEPIFLACSGSGAMEAALLNVLEPGDEIIAINAGKFGERWLDIAGRIGSPAHQIASPAGEAPSLEAIEAVVRAHPNARAFCMQVCETSTTTQLPVAKIIPMVRAIAPEMLLIVDAISSLVAAPLSMQQLGIDILVGASQKAFMIPPGLSMLSMSDRAWTRIDSIPARSLYFDLRAEKKAHDKGTTAWTPAMNIILGLNESLKMLAEEGFENVYERHRLCSVAARAGLQALGLKTLADTHPSPSVTAAFMPQGIDADKVRSSMATNFGFRIAGGQDDLTGKIIRIGHLGMMHFLDIVGALSALELSLIQHGHAVTPGTAAGAALAAIGSK